MDVLFLAIFSKLGFPFLLFLLTDHHSAELFIPRRMLIFFLIFVLKQFMDIDKDTRVLTQCTCLALSFPVTEKARLKVFCHQPVDKNFIHSGSDMKQHLKLHAVRSCDD